VSDRLLSCPHDRNTLSEKRKDVAARGVILLKIARAHEKKKDVHSLFNINTAIFHKK